MKRFLLLQGCLLLLRIGVSHAQQKAMPRNYLKINPTTLVNELDLYLEHAFSTSTSMEASIGGIYTDYWDHLLNQFDFGQINPNFSESQYLNAKGVNARLGLRYYVLSPYAPETRARGTYFEPLLLYKKVWYPTDDKTIGNKNYPEKGSKRILGLQLLIGRQHQKGKWIIDKYLGLGVKAKTYSFDNYQSSGGSGTVKNFGDRTTSWVPSLHAGIKIGFGL